ncbi:MAG: hypothetical protein J6K16_00795 [Alphaproteobacteria bacterium]|nr:hypothetical protein [Alphaproteobacteria bacterium]
MTSFQLFIGLLLTLIMIMRPFLYKPAAEHFPLNLSSLFTSTWLIVCLVLSFPWFGHLYTDRFIEITTSPYLLLSMLKGILLWVSVKLQQSINKQSTSSSSFYTFVSLALSSLINNIFFHEGLKLFQILCICGFGVLGIAFIIMGDARRLSVKNKIAFFIAVIIGALFSVQDHIAIPQIGWYAHLLYSSIFMFLTCLIAKVSKNDFKIIFKNKSIVTAGSFFGITEFLIIYASINILPVTFVSMFMRLATPIVMLVSAFKYKEQSWKNQLIFGIISLALALPLILIK